MTAEQFDYVMVSAGSTGRSVASCLSERGRSSLPLEDRPEICPNSFLNMLSGFLRLMFSRRCNWQFNTEPQRHMYDRALFQPRGKMLVPG